MSYSLCWIQVLVVEFKARYFLYINVQLRNSTNSKWQARQRRALADNIGIYGTCTQKGGKVLGVLIDPWEF